MYFKIFPLINQHRLKSNLFNTTFLSKQNKQLTARIYILYTVYFPALCHGYIIHYFVLQTVLQNLNFLIALEKAVEKFAYGSCSHSISRTHVSIKQLDYELKISIV